MPAKALTTSSMLLTLLKSFFSLEPLPVFPVYVHDIQVDAHEDVHYAHSYVAVLPKHRWAASVKNTNAMLSLVSQSNSQSYNHVEISTFPTGDVNSTRLLGNETFQYNVNTTGLALNSNGDSFFSDQSLYG